MGIYINLTKEGKNIETIMVINKKNVLLISIISFIAVIIIFLYFNNDKSYEKIREILPENYYEIDFSDGDAYKNVKFTKEIKKELSDLLIANDIKELDKDDWLKIEPMKFIEIVSDGKTKLLIYAESDNTYIECYENGKVFRTYITENDLTEKIKNIINISVN